MRHREICRTIATIKNVPLHRDIAKFIVPSLEREIRRFIATSRNPIATPPAPKGHKTKQWKLNERFIHPAMRQRLARHKTNKGCRLQQASLALTASEQ
jgi:hypothetical protein